MICIYHILNSICSLFGGKRRENGLEEDQSQVLDLLPFKTH